MDASEHARLLERVAGGDRQAFASLYEELERPLFRFICSKMNDRFEAGDILQEVFVEVWRSAEKFEGRSAVKSWVFGIAYRKTMDRFRKSSRLEPLDEAPEQADLSPDQLTRLAAMEQAEGVRVCLDELSAAHRLTIELAFFEDMSYPDIAVATGAPEGTVKTRVFNAKKLLLRCLSKLLGMRAP